MPSIEIRDTTTSPEKGNFILYAIHSPFGEARRRYSEFEALRTALVQLHPTVLIPPLPPKHTLSDYALKQSKAKDDPVIIAQRQRMLQAFLNRLFALQAVYDDTVLQRFLRPNHSWVRRTHSSPQHDIATSPPLSNLPKNNLAGPPSNPAEVDASPSYKALPTPTVPRKLREPDTHFADAEGFTRRFAQVLASHLEPADRRLRKRWQDICTDYGDIAALLNAQGLREPPALAPLLECSGQACDAVCLAGLDMLQKWASDVSELINVHTQYAGAVQRMLTWRHLKQQQLEVSREIYAAKRVELDALEWEEKEYARLNLALEQGRDLGNTVPQRSIYGSAAEEGSSPWADTREHVQESEESHTVADEEHAPSQPRQPSQPSGAPRPVTTSMLGSLAKRLHSVIDRDPERTRQITIMHLRDDLGEGIQLLEQDVCEASREIQASLDEFQLQKVAEFKQFLLAYAKMHRDFCRQGLQAWQRVQQHVEGIEPDAWGGMPDAQLLVND